ncbi:C-reactive protein-like [Pelodytes ibericus]
MKRPILWFMFLAVSLAKQDLSGKVFIFPKETVTSYVYMQPEMSKPLNKLTVCLNSYTELNREHSLFSLAITGQGKANTFLIISRPPNLCSVYINKDEIRLKIDKEVLDWKQTCVSWDSDTGIIQLWVNGKLYPRKVSNKGFTIPVSTSIMLGQEQDTFGGGFNVRQSFVGEISDVNMWDYVLTPEDIQKVLESEKTGNVINWASLKYDSKGDVLVQPKLQCKSWGHTPIMYSPCY